MRLVLHFSHFLLNHNLILYLIFNLYNIARHAFFWLETAIFSLIGGKFILFQLFNFLDYSVAAGGTTDKTDTLPGKPSWNMPFPGLLGKVLYILVNTLTADVLKPKDQEKKLSEWKTKWSLDVWHDCCFSVTRQVWRRTGSSLMASPDLRILYANVS